MAGDKSPFFTLILPHFVSAVRKGLSQFLFEGNLPLFLNSLPPFLGSLPVLDRKKGTRNFPHTRKSSICNLDVLQDFPSPSAPQQSRLTGNPSPSSSPPLPSHTPLEMGGRKLLWKDQGSNVLTSRSYFCLPEEEQLLSSLQEV